MFGFFKKTLPFSVINEEMERKDNFYFDVDTKYVRIKGTDIFGPLKDLTFKSVKTGEDDFTVEEARKNGGYRVGDKIPIYANEFDEDAKEVALSIINDMTRRCEESIKETVNLYNHNKEFIFNPTLAVDLDNTIYWLFICLRPGDIKTYFDFLEEKGATTYIDEYKNYVLKCFKVRAVNDNYQYDMVVTVYPYLTWLDNNKEKLDTEKKREEENAKCKEIFDMIREAK